MKRVFKLMILLECLIFQQLPNPFLFNPLMKYWSKLFSLPHPPTSWQFFSSPFLLKAFMPYNPFCSRDLCLFCRSIFSHESLGGWNSWPTGRSNHYSSACISRHIGAYSWRKAADSWGSSWGREYLVAFYRSRQGKLHYDILAKQGKPTFSSKNLSFWKMK